MKKAITMMLGIFMALTSIISFCRYGNGVMLLSGECANASQNIMINDEKPLVIKDIVNEENKLEYKFRIHIPKITGLKDTKKQNAINEAISKDIFRFRDGFIENAKGGDNSEAEVYYTVTNNKKIFSLIVYYYEYYGGAHGLTTKKSINIYVPNSGGINESQNFLTIGDLFLDKVDYRSLINKYIISEIKKEPAKYFEDTVEKYTGFNENNFYFNDKGLVIYFQSYEIAPYASGSPEFNISYSFLRNYLKKDFIP
ncbi:DUF3298 and DUF4163 domain-containing protein [Clostridium bornimense]|uniref:DUF3298 and DUF4163 domain-containing protein n=1 Tax=Clostridium bornimense TaxID=1216932 RepID=UPI001C122C1B|nr:DUF3298 and DUF4163 domain-containing protein [Clostridium bornimense]